MRVFCLNHWAESMASSSGGKPSNSSPPEMSLAEEDVVLLDCSPSDSDAWISDSMPPGSTAMDGSRALSASMMAVASGGGGEISAPICKGSSLELAAVSSSQDQESFGRRWTAVTASSPSFCLNRVKLRPKLTGGTGYHRNVSPSTSRPWISHEGWGLRRLGLQPKIQPPADHYLPAQHNWPRWAGIVSDDYTPKRLLHWELRRIGSVRLGRVPAGGCGSSPCPRQGVPSVTSQKSSLRSWSAGHWNVCCGRASKPRKSWSTFSMEKLWNATSGVHQA